MDIMSLELVLFLHRLNQRYLLSEQEDLVVKY